MQKKQRGKIAHKIYFTSGTNIFHIDDNIPARRSENGRHSQSAGRSSMPCGDA